MLRDGPRTTGEICDRFPELDRCTVMRGGVQVNAGLAAGWEAASRLRDMESTLHAADLGPRLGILLIKRGRGIARRLQPPRLNP